MSLEGKSPLFRTQPRSTRLVNSRYIPYYIYAEANPGDFWSTYGKGVSAVTFELPLICVIDPNNADACIAGSRSPDHMTSDNFQLFYTTLQQYAAATPSCAATISPSARAFDAPSGSGTISVTSSASCSWTPSSDKTWITITTGGAHTGNGTVSYTVSANTGSLRTGTITIGGQTFTVTQNGSTTCAYTISPTTASFKASPTITIRRSTGNKGTVAVTTSKAAVPGVPRATLRG